MRSPRKGEREANLKMTLKFKSLGIQIQTMDLHDVILSETSSVFSPRNGEKLLCLVGLTPALGFKAHKMIGAPLGSLGVVGRPCCGDTWICWRAARCQSCCTEKC